MKCKVGGCFIGYPSDLDIGYSVVRERAESQEAERVLATLPAGGMSNEDIVAAEGEMETR